MQHVLAAAARTFHERIGWNRLGLLLSLAIIGIAAWTLVRLLADVDFAEVLAALHRIPGHTILLAAALVAAAFFTITFYDFFALRTIGRPDIPYPVAALASCTSFTIGHNVGAMVLTAGIVRLRIYSPYNLAMIDIAKIAFVTGLTFWLGNTTVLGLGVLYDPDTASALNQLPDWINRVLAFTALAAIAGYIAWLAFRSRAIGAGEWRLVLPNARLTFLQILIGAADLTFTSLAMYVLLPPMPPIDFLGLMFIFVLATLVGFVSHAPGGFGVFDAAMLVALPQFQKEELLASLLVFRLIYYIAPFLIAVTLLGARELIAWAAARSG